LTASFPICIPFISSSCVIALAMNSKTMLNNSGKSRHPHFLPDFRGNGFMFSPFNMVLAIGLSYIPFIMLRYNPLFLVSSELLSWKLIEGCSCFYWDDHVVFVFALLIWALHLIVCICWTIPASLGWSWLDHGVWSFWYVVEFSLPKFYWDFGHHCTLKRLTCNFLFCCVFVWFWDECNLAS
jgi:hypothetical protein